MLALDVVAGKFTQSKEIGIVPYLFETEPAPQNLKVSVVGAGKRLRQTHAGAASDGDHCIFGNDPLTERGQSHGNLNGRTRLCTLRKSEFLVDHRKDST